LNNLKKSITCLHALFLVKEGAHSQNLAISLFSQARGARKFFLRLTVHQKNCKLWPLVQVKSKRLFMIDVSLSISALFVVLQGVEGITYPVIHSSVHGKHDGEGLEFMQHSIRKLFCLVAISTCNLFSLYMLTVQINPYVTATL